MSNYGWRPHIESALSLDVWRLYREGLLRDGKRGGWQWSRDGESFASMGYAVTLHDTTGMLALDYTHTNRDGEREAVTCAIRLLSIPLHYGGRRWYGHCPYTGRRARKLCKFSGIAQFCHRTAIRPLPTYAIQRKSGLSRVQAQRWALRHKLGDEWSDLFGEPCKPKWMRWRTFERYANRDAELSQREDDYLSPFLYRLLLKTGGLGN
ncbi:MAG: hypothetical protein KGK05_03810 [Xanthomonadaceae bacterium]|nr:hypothetical protein [Xanthomonadaceae bacterium]